MKQYPMKFAKSLLSSMIFSVCFLASCNWPTADSNSNLSVHLNKSSLTLEEGEEATLVATVTAKGIGKPTLTWSSGDSSKVTVDKNGNIKAIGLTVKPVTITVAVSGTSTATGHEMYSDAFCYITVRVSEPPPPPPPEPKPVTGITISQVSFNIIVNASTKLTASVQPWDATNKNVIWSSSNPDAAVVENGLVTAIAVGTATISAVTGDGGFSADCEVTVINYPIISVVNDSEIANKKWWRIVFGNNTFIALPDDKGKIFRSTDNGVSWIEASDSTFDNSNIWAIAYGDDAFIAVGDHGKMARSTDNGVTWTAVADSGFDSTLIYDIAFGNNVFIAVGEDGKMTRSTDNGITWTTVNVNLFDAGTIYGIIFGNNTFIADAAVKDEYIGQLFCSIDGGLTWTEVNDSPSIHYYDGVLYANAAFFAIDGSSNNKIVFSTDNCITWTPLTMSTSGTINSIAYGGNVLIAVKQYPNTLFYSMDLGATWNAFAGAEVTHFAFGNNIFIATCDSGGMVRLEF